jgi:hypothetical protein
LGAVLAETGEAERAAEGEVLEFGSGLVIDDGLVAAVGDADGLRGLVGGDDVTEELAELRAGLERVDDGAVVADGEVKEVADAVETVDAFVGEWDFDDDLGARGAVG